MALTASERVTIIKEIGKRLSDEEWPLVDLTLKQFGLKTFDEWRGDKNSYVIEIVENAGDDVLVELAKHVGYVINGGHHNIEPAFWVKNRLRMTEHSVINYKNKSFSVTAEVMVPPKGAEGVIIAVGGIIGGWSLYAKAGKLIYHYNFYGVERFTIESAKPIPSGTHQVRMEFAYDGDGLAKDGDVTLFVDGCKTGEGRVEKTEPLLFSTDETCDVGFQSGTPSSPDYGPHGNRFSGEVNWVEIDLGTDPVSLDHLINPEGRLRLAMARQ